MKPNPDRKPNRQELLKILNEHNVACSSTTYGRLVKAERDASAAMDKFMKTNKTFVRLERSAEAAREKRYNADSAMRDERRRIINLVRLEGPSPRVLKAIRKLIK
jgi:hypothetical protein